jgi:hypothetical protein
VKTALFVTKEIAMERTSGIVEKSVLPMLLVELASAALRFLSMANQPEKLASRLPKPEKNATVDALVSQVRLVST